MYSTAMRKVSRTFHITAFLYFARTQCHMYDLGGRFHFKSTLLKGSSHSPASKERVAYRPYSLLLQRGIDPLLHLLNYSLCSKTLSESLMRMEKNITSWVISTEICFQRLFITLILRLC